MNRLSFSEFVAASEGLLAPDRPPAAGMSRINVTPLTNDQRRRLRATPVRPGSAIRPVKVSVPQVVPPNLVGRIKPSATGR
jgi:hypothetical protein